MSPLSRKTIEMNLQKKGFRKNESDHKLYILYYKGKKTNIRTKISRGSEKYRDYGDDLLLKMRRQLKLDSLSQAKNFLSCPLSIEDYITILKLKDEL